MAVRITIKHYGGEVAIKAMGNRAFRLRNVEPALYEVGLDQLDAIKGVFDTQGRRGGGSWRKLAPATIARRKRAGVDTTRILVVSRKLMASVTQFAAPNQIFEVKKSQLRIGSSLPYARLQQRGGDHVPARPFLKFTAGDEKSWAETIAAYVVGERGPQWNNQQPIKVNWKKSVRR